MCWFAETFKCNIPGNKMNNVGIVYTAWENLKKTNDMEVGQVGFVKQKEVCFKTYRVTLG